MLKSENNLLYSDLATDLQKWLKLVEELGFDREVYQSDGPVTIDSLSRFFDSSHRGLLRVFHLFDRDQDSTVTQEEFGEGLSQQGLYINGAIGKAALEKVWSLVEKEGVVRAPEFLWVLKNLRLAALMHGYMSSLSGEEISIYSHEYREDKIVHRAPLESPVNYLFQPPGFAEEEGMAVRWLHAHNPSRKTILGLGMKFGIDPRFISDIFGLWREPARADALKGPTKVLKHPALVPADSNQIFIIIPVLRLTKRSEASIRPYEIWRRSKQTGNGQHTPPPCVVAEVEHCNMALLVVGEGDAATVISFTSEWGILSKLVSDDNSLKSVEALTNMSVVRQSHLGSPPEKAVIPRSFSLTSDQSENDALSAFRRIMTTLHSSYSHLRTGDAHTFLLKTLCEVSEDYLAVSKAYDYGLNVLQKRLDRERDDLSQRDVRAIRKSVRQLSHLYRLVSPVMAVADSLTNMKWSGDAQLYLSDIKGNVSRFLDDALAHREFSRGMIDQFQNFCETKTSQILFLLTRVTTLFVPGQFLASVYGMNFMDSAGTSTIPEMSWKYGYLYYWMTVITLTAIVFSVIHYLTKRD